MAGGYMGRVLRIDLSRKKAEEQTFTEEICRNFIGVADWGPRSSTMKPVQTQTPLAQKAPSSL
jgi:aldehyde:ferredoxin oxidoreductase